MGAGTFHPATFLRALGPEPWKAAYVQPCRRPTDGRYGENPNRLQHYYQLQVVMKPEPENFQQLYLGSLDDLGIDRSVHDVRFVEDNWESPTLGAWGLGWEVWLDGMEVTQFTYFQQVGGVPCQPVTGEITYGLERLAMYLQGIDNVYDLAWSDQVSYGELFLRNEKEQSAFNFDCADLGSLAESFASAQQQANALADRNLLIPAYEAMMTASHLFNLMDARRELSPTLRQEMVLKVRQMACRIAQDWLGQTSVDAD